MISVTALYEEHAIIFKWQLKKLKKLKATCQKFGNNMEEIWDIKKSNIASLGARSGASLSGEK